ncbi:MAG: hypothetical protein KJO23_00200, partial [Bacteroidia bacterium]|nr:hypothetical protein [Bacteroidia bacterium]
MISCLALCLACGGKLYNIDHPYVDRIDELKEFNATDFSTYVFNICEKFDSKTNYTERFCPCPDNFYELKPTDSIKKIEEVYFMLNEPANLAIYVTTRSHKYISNSRRGFLNDPLQYKDKINLNQIEYIYIGNLDNTQNKIYFPHPRGDENHHIILEYNRDVFPERLLLEQANIATAENKYNTRVPIPLEQVFNTRLEFKMKNYE